MKEGNVKRRRVGMRGADGRLDGREGEEVRRQPQMKEGKEGGLEKQEEGRGIVVGGKQKLFNLRTYMHSITLFIFIHNFTPFFPLYHLKKRDRQGKGKWKRQDDGG